MTPRCSVILPTYNRARVLPRAVESVLAQDMADFELIVVDDASTDGTADYLSSVSDPRLRTLRAERNGGPSAARNLGLEAARAPILSFLDSDDFYRPNRLSRTLAAFAAEPGIVGTLSSSIKRNQLSDVPLILPDVTLTAAAFEWGLFCGLIAVESSSMTLRRDAAIAAGGFSTALRRSEDREFLIRLARQGPGRLLSDVLWEKTWSEDGLSQDRLNIAADYVRYVVARPEYIQRYPKVGSYFATQILWENLRRLQISLFRSNLRQFIDAGILTGTFFTVWAAHREVKKYRAATANNAALLRLKGPPDQWA